MTPRKRGSVNAKDADMVKALVSRDVTKEVRMKMIPSLLLIRLLQSLLKAISTVYPIKMLKIIES